MTEKLVCMSLALPMGQLPHYLPVVVTHKVHQICFYTAGFE